MTTIIGEGSYGKVTVRDGKAVKTFAKLSHLIQEYVALRYLNNCSYIVKSEGVNFGTLELYMELYDCSLRKWLEEQRENGSVNKNLVMEIIRYILLGLVELHDRKLAHGDLKPGNILIRKNPFKLVLGDCGFVSVDKYAKVDRTAAIYRDPVVNHHYSHDMYSFGICFLEMIAEIKINRQANYDELKRIVQDKIHNSEYRKIIYNLVHSNKDRRPTARVVLYRLFSINPLKWTYSSLSITDNNKNSVSYDMLSITSNEKKYIRTIMKGTAYEFNINRGKKGFGALLLYIHNHSINLDHYRIYTAITLMILSSLFGKSGFRENEVIELCDNKYDIKFIYQILNNMLSDYRFINILLAP